jgi:hypothetical protein
VWVFSLAEEANLHEVSFFKVHYSLPYANHYTKDLRINQKKDSQ